MYTSTGWLDIASTNHLTFDKLQLIKEPYFLDSHVYQVLQEGYQLTLTLLDYVPEVNQYRETGKFLSNKHGHVGSRDKSSNLLIEGQTLL